MSVKLITNKLSIKESFIDDFVNGMKSQLGINTETLQNWLSKRGLKEEELKGVKADLLLRAYAAGRNLTLSINKNNNGKVYFDLDGLIIPLDLMNLIYKDWNNSDLKMINQLNTNKYDLVENFNNDAYDKLKNFINDFHLNLFNEKWSKEELNYFNRMVLSSNTNTKELNKIIASKIATDLFKSNISDEELKSLLKIKSSTVSRDKLCIRIIQNILNYGKPEGNKNQND